MKTFNYKGRTFTVNKKALCARQTDATLWDVYKNVSAEKERTYRGWKDFFANNSGTKFLGVQSHNVFQYTLGFMFTMDGVLYKAYITACNNYAYPIG